MDKVLVDRCLFFSNVENIQRWFPQEWTAVGKVPSRNGIYLARCFVLDGFTLEEFDELCQYLAKKGIIEYDQGLIRKPEQETSSA